jgi:hypothetical protein
MPLASHSKFPGAEMTEAIEYRRATTRSDSAAASQQLQSLLVSGETVVASALQHRFYALLHRRHVAAATTGRFIFMTRRLLGGYDPIAIRWQDLKDVGINVGVFSASVVISYSADLSDTAGDEGRFQTLRASGLRKETAQALYRECQTQEQSWREKRRVRSMEEMRARSGATQIATGIYPQGSFADRPTDLVGGPSSHETPAQRLARAKEMLTEQLISDAEYEAIKAKIVGSL